MAEDFEKTNPLLRPEDLDELDKTEEFLVPAAPSDMSWDAIIDRAKIREKEMKEGVRQTVESIMGGPVYVDEIKYLGDGQFEIRVSVGKGREAQSHTVVVKEPERKFE